MGLEREQGSLFPKRSGAWELARGGPQRGGWLRRGGHSRPRGVKGPGRAPLVLALQDVSGAAGGGYGSSRMSRPREVSTTYTYPSPGMRMPMAPS